MALYKYFKKETDCNSAFITTGEIEKAGEKVKQVLDASDRNSCSGKLTPRCKYNVGQLNSEHKLGDTLQKMEIRRQLFFCCACLVQKSMNRHVLGLRHQKRIEICACLCMRESASAGIRQIKISPNCDFFSTSRTICQIFCPPNFPAIR